MAPDRDWPNREISTGELAGSFRDLKGSVDRLSGRLDGLDQRYVMQAVDVERERRWSGDVAALRRELSDVTQELARANDKLNALSGLPKEVADLRATLRWVSRTAVTSLLIPIIVAVLVAIALRGV
jgi:hypothetical protein